MCHALKASSDQPYTAVRARSPKSPRNVCTGFGRRGGCGGMKGFVIGALFVANANDPHHVSRDPNLSHGGLEARPCQEVTYVGGAFFDRCSGLSRELREIGLALREIEHELVGRTPVEQHVELTAILRSLFVLAEPGDKAPVLLVERSEAVEPLSVAIADLGQPVRKQRDLLDLDPVFAAGRAVYAGADWLARVVVRIETVAHPTAGEQQRCHKDQEAHA